MPYTYDEFRFCSVTPANKGLERNREKGKRLGRTLNLTEKQQQSILTELNTRSLEQLKATKYIGKNKAEALIQHRDQHGLLSSLQDLSGVRGFGKAFYDRLEKAGELPPITQKFSRQMEVIKTLLPEGALQKVDSIVSIDIGLQNAAWTHIDRDCQVLAWKQVHITRPKPYNPAILRPQIQKFVDSLPAADAHVIEMQSHRVGKHAAALLPFVIHLRIVESMLHCLLPSPCIPFDPHYTSKVFALPSGHTKKKKAAISLVESLFQENKPNPIEEECENFLKEQSGLQGSKDIVRNLVEGVEGGIINESAEDTSGDEENVGHPPAELDCSIRIPEELISYFELCKKKDDLSDSLLQALAFFHLIKQA
ncbi:predicted protein [Nematostella vectensis]|uniref:Transcription elongation factor, mitochondrial n=1 Tax=Nematostella vectensis TaxID=45351 RepID=A7SH52_NEMVE|nr:predicted protein [Nematostella vectensis]|eukprot:XP_001629051.1 predicted protein [Nematostella vectensis]